MPRWPRRHLAVLLLSLPILGLATGWTEFESVVEVECTESGVRCTLNGQSVELPVVVGHLRNVSLIASESFFPLGARGLTFTRPDGALLLTLDPPRHFRFPTGEARPLAADWWIDRTPVRSEVYHQWTSVEPPFVLRTTISGRGLQHIELVLTGETQVTFAFRNGWLHNDMYVVDQTEEKKQTVLLGPYPALDARHALHAIFGGLTIAAILFVIFHAAAWLTRRWPASPLWKISWRWVFVAVNGISAVMFLWTAYSILDARPHFQDDLGYLLRAKWLSAGHFSFPKPVFAEQFAIPFTVIFGERWISQYPIGWCALLALGELANAPWIVSPLCGIVAVWAVWRLGSETAGGAVGAMAATLLTFSPLAVILSGSMMSHAATAMWLLLFVWQFIRGWEGQGHRARMAFAGVALGLAFSTRPLTGVAVALPAGIFVVVELWRRHFAGRAWWLLVWLVGGGLVGTLPALIDNWQVTGHPWRFAYQIVYPNFWDPAAFPVGLFWTDRTLAMLPPLAFGWGWPGVASWWPMLALPFGFAAVPFLARRATRVDWLLLGVLASVLILYVGFSVGTGLHGFGPRFYFDVFFALVLLTARGIQILATTGAQWGHSPLPRRMAGALFLALTLSTVWSLPSRLRLYRGYNDVDGRVERWVASLPTKRGLILIDRAAPLSWLRAARLLPTDLRADVVFAWKDPDNTALIAAYAGWPVYQLNNDRLEPYRLSQ